MNEDIYTNRSLYDMYVKMPVYLKVYDDAKGRRTIIDKKFLVGVDIRQETVGSEDVWCMRYKYLPNDYAVVRFRTESDAEMAMDLMETRLTEADSRSCYGITRSPEIVEAVTQADLDRGDYD